MSELPFENLYSHEMDIYSLQDFTPVIVDQAYLRALGVEIDAAPETMDGLRRGSEVFLERLRNRTVIPVSRVTVDEIDPEAVDTEIHNYTGRCPTLTFELNPVQGCNVGCQYCLVTDGVHEQTLIAHGNYHLYVRKLLREMNGTPTREITPEDIRRKDSLLQELAVAIEKTPEKKKDIERQITEISKGKNWNHYYYFSPKTEALQEPTLYTGIAHRILKEFIRHYEEFPRGCSSRPRRGRSTFCTNTRAKRSWTCSGSYAAKCSTTSACPSCRRRSGISWNLTRLRSRNGLPR